ncbi:MAG TPA: hypothetical protein VGQ42_15585 [Candidatus Dormibacteraeota bacterium]|jgi:hypothetical protein|nr:hypothetical protein [Candidatus Dormibacteraeota bacterium]
MKATPAIAAAALLLAACGSGAAVSTSTTATPPPQSASPAVSLDARWCALVIGESEQAAMSAMGSANGHQADSYLKNLGLPPGYTYAEWDHDATILLATFASGVVVNLQAYAGQIGPAGATNTGCAAFRH